MRPDGWPDGQFDVIYADPPWPFVGGPQKTVERHYPTMPVEEIAALPVAEAAAESAAVFIWVVNSFTWAVFDVIEAWGFPRESASKAATWCKLTTTGKRWFRGLGHRVAQQTETCWIATRGGGMKPAVVPEEILEARIREHSRKPDAMYRRIEAMYPESRYLELFARQQRDGWQSWGNDTLRFPTQQPLFETVG